MKSTERRRWLKQVAVLAAITPGGIVGVVRQALAAGNAPIAAGVQRIKGEVSINGKPALQGMLVAAGDTVRTGPGAEIVYVIGQDAFLQRDNSVVSFGVDAAQNLMRVVSGKILSVFGKGPRTIKTSTATFGIRGTGCYIEDTPAGQAQQGFPSVVGAGETAMPTGQSRPEEATAIKAANGPASSTYFCLCYGEVELIPTAAPHEKTIYRTRHHEKPLTISDDMSMPTMMAPAKVINHTDMELTLLESLVGRNPPFAGRQGKYY